MVLQMDECDLSFPPNVAFPMSLKTALQLLITFPISTC